MMTLTMSPEQGKEIKISQWFIQYGKRLLHFVQSKIHDLEEAEDISQEVWYQLSRQNEIEQIKEIGSWLFNAANNRVINFYKKKKNIPFSNLENPIDSLESFEVNITDDLSLNAWASERLSSEIVESKEFWELLQKMLEKLPVEQREVFIEHELNDISFRELAEKTGLSINTLLARKSYAVKKLRQEFEIIFNQ